MARVSVLILLAVLASSVARAGFENVDPNKQADIGNKVIDTPVLNYDSIPQPTRGQPREPLSDKKAVRDKKVDTKSVETKIVNDYSTVPAKTVPQSNYKTKRAEIEQKNVDVSTIPNKAAEINDHIIYMNTPGGQQEIKGLFDKNQR